MNVKQTLRNLHKKFPMMNLDELFEILDCYVGDSYLSNLTSEPNKIWYNNMNSTTGIEAVPAIMANGNLTTTADFSSTQASH